jgi:uncharacterized membrane protein AbrB (regulator of aidB expression)
MEAARDRSWRGAAYLLLGTRIGSRFDLAVLRRIRDLPPWVLGFIALLTAPCAGLGWVLAAQLSRLLPMLVAGPVVAMLEAGDTESG